jgi:hypothetical protein
MPIAPLNDLACLDCIGDSQYHEIHFYEKTTAKDQYRSSYGTAKFDVAMAHFNAKLRRAITRSILDRCCHIMHINVTDNII